MINRYICPALIALLVTVPFLVPYHAYPLVTFHVEWLALTLGALLAMLALQQYSSAAPRILPMLIGFAFLLGAHAVYLTHWQKPTLAALYVVDAALVIWATRTTLLYRWSVARTTLWALAVGGFIAAVMGFIQHFDLRTVIGAINADRSLAEGMMGPLGQRNMLAAYLGVGLCAALTLSVSHKRWLIPLLVGTTMVTAMAFTGSRVAWLFMVIAVLPVMSSSKTERVWVMLLLLFTALRFTVAEDAVHRLPGLANAEEAVSPRWYYLISMLRMWWDHPLTGVGWGEFAYNVFTHAQPGDPRFIDRHAHNAVAQILAETGMLGVTMLGVALLYWIKDVWRFTFSFNFVGFVEQRGLIAVLLVIVVFSMTEFPLWHAQFLMLTAVIMGLLPQRSFPIHDAVRRVGVLIAGVGVILATVLYVQYVKLEEFYAQRVHEISADAAFTQEIEFMMILNINPPADKLPQYAEMLRRAMHTFPSPAVTCRYATTLSKMGNEKGRQAVLVQIGHVYGEDSARQCFEKGDLS